MGQPLPVEIAQRFDEYSEGTSCERLFDGAVGTFWCTNVSPSFPQTLVLRLGAPSVVESVQFDPRVPGYEQCGPREVSVELSPDGKQFVPAGGGTVTMALATAIAVAPSEPCVAVRVQIHSNWGGQTLAAAELRVVGTPAARVGAKPAEGAWGEATKMGWEPAKAAWGESATPAAVPSVTFEKREAWVSDPGEPNAAGVKQDAWVSDPQDKPQARETPSAKAIPYERTSMGVGGNDQQWSVGQRIVAEREPGKLCTGKVVTASNAMFEIAWDDGAKPSWLSGDALTAK